MRLFCAGVVRLALCSLFVAAINLDGCLRGALVIQRANSNPPLRKAIKEAFNFSVGANGTIAGVLVLSKDRQASVYAALAGRRKEYNAVTFEYDNDYDIAGSIKPISFDQFFNYLTCQRF
ncbi:unnamed protein product [Heligmosomoides polygyrus]|uniref:VWFA domain-containing protein n=1 Tax=Heligmosomoides polygyrus TaxID=6339 RepID=A0A183FYB5_HELPZ|nr:unnamed protein product [Heligmosomoides polygyrus]